MQHVLITSCYSSDDRVIGQQPGYVCIYSDHVLFNRVPLVSLVLLVELDLLVLM